MTRGTRSLEHNVFFAFGRVVPGLFLPPPIFVVGENWGGERSVSSTRTQAKKTVGTNDRVPPVYDTRTGWMQVPGEHPMLVPTQSVGTSIGQHLVLDQRQMYRKNLF